MLKNPYPIPTDENDQASCRFATYIDAADKALMHGLRPVKGTPQAIVNNLILNICNDLRDLKLTSYHPDADDILAILTERRPLTDEQITRLRLTTAGLSEQVPSWLQHHRRKSSVREGATGVSKQSADTKGGSTSGVKRDRKDSSDTEKVKGGKSSDDRRRHS